MNIEKSSQMRLMLQRLMHEKNISLDIWLPIYHHIAFAEVDQGDKIVVELLSMIESGATETEISQIAQEKYKIDMK